MICHDTSTIEQAATESESDQVSVQGDETSGTESDCPVPAGSDSPGGNTVAINRKNRGEQKKGDTDQELEEEDDDDDWMKFQVSYPSTPLCLSYPFHSSLCHLPFPLLFVSATPLCVIVIIFTLHTPLYPLHPPYPTISSSPFIPHLPLCVIVVTLLLPPYMHTLIHY